MSKRSLASIPTIQEPDQVVDRLTLNLHDFADIARVIECASQGADNINVDATELLRGISTTMRRMADDLDAAASDVRMLYHMMSEPKAGAR